MIRARATPTRRDQRLSSSPEVVREALAGHRPAREALVATHGPLVFGLCRRLARDAEDAYQEIWEKAFRSLHTYDPAVGRFEPWLATIARRHLIDRHRRQAVRGEVVSVGELVSTGPDAYELAARGERREGLESALARLVDGQRRVVVLHHVHGLSLDEIAREERVAVGTVKSRLHRGRARLAQLLGGNR